MVVYPSLLDFFLSRLDMFKGNLIFGYFIIFLLISITLYIYRNKRFYEHITKIGISYKYIFITTSVLFIFILIFYLCNIFENSSIFPVGWDRGHHFGIMLDLINSNHLPLFEPGTLYKPFYFQGFNTTISTYTLLTSPFSELSIAGLSKSFIFFNSIIIALYPIAVYSVALHMFTSKKIALLAAIAFVPIAAREFISAGPLAENLGIIFLGGLIIISCSLITYKNTNHRKIIILLAIFIGAIALTHIIAIAFAILTLVLFSLWAYVKKEITIKGCIYLYILIIASLLVTAGFLFLTNPNLTYGIIDEVIRKNAEPGLGWLSSSLGSYFTDSFELTLNNLKEVISILLAPFFVIGIIMYIRRNKGYLIPLLISSLFFIFIPILPFNRPSYYLVYPMTLFSGLGIYYMFKYIINNGYYRYFVAFIMILSIITIGVIDSFDRVNYLGETRTEYWPQDEYNQSFQLIEWIEHNIDSTSIIACPDSSPLGYLLIASVTNTVLFADPKWLDVPSYQEIALIYNIETPEMARMEIVEKHDISTIIVIVYSEEYLEIIETIRDDFPGSDIYQPTSLHTVITINKI